ncbi:MAG: HAD family hydrolase [Litorimonas sp.]
MNETPVCQIRIAMWSGPRNLSTAMMRSFGARADTVCVDEPFYAAYLDMTGQAHPMRDEILARHETNPLRVINEMVNAPPLAPIFYQKQMTHHMLQDIPRQWMGHVRNVFLIRHPARVLASYIKKMEAISLEAIGFAQQLDLFNFAQSLSGETPIVIDSDDILKNPKGMLCSLCEHLGIAYDEAMLSWAQGGRPEDGAWAPHWYDAVCQSTGFSQLREEIPELAPEYKDIQDKALEIYESLAQFRIRPLQKSLI